jgi:osmotically-inducible protein OsmY
MIARETNRFRNILLPAAACCLALVLAGCDKSPTTTKASDTQTSMAQPNAATPAQPSAIQATADTQKPDPDAALADKVKAALAGDKDTKLLPIDVRSSDGAVTLYGTADNKRLRSKAEQIAMHVEGVKSVSNNLQVVSGS